MDNLEKFVRDFLDDKVEPYLKSEPVPDNTDAPVKVRERIMLQLLRWLFYYLLREVEMWKLTLDIFLFCQVVVAKNFDEIVNDPERDVLIEFYAPWCGHCKQLEPKYTELAEKVSIGCENWALGA